MLHQYNINGAIRDFIGLDQCGIRVYRKDGKMIGYLGSYPDGFWYVTDDPQTSFLCLRQNAGMIIQARDLAIQLDPLT
jgi:hypothetical protein